MMTVALAVWIQNETDGLPLMDEQLIVGGKKKPVQSSILTGCQPANTQLKPQMIAYRL